MTSPDCDAELRNTPINMAAENPEFRRALSELILNPGHNVIELAVMPDYLQQMYGLTPEDIDVVYEVGWNRIMEEYYGYDKA